MFTDLHLCVYFIILVVVGWLVYKNGVDDDDYGDY